ncbi:MAG TPA: CatB-related O-acetyltransferase [Terriglobia bacterium]|nr:CatB-related O-acetyltransferase [Terriglobia bacterium]
MRHPNGIRSWLGPLLVKLYGLLPLGFARSLLRSLADRLEGGEGLSLTLREIMRKYHGVEIGLYTGGAPFVPGAFRWGTRIGRFNSINWTARAFNADHPMKLKSTHPYFFNRRYGIVARDLIRRPGLEVGNDVWMGHNSIILPSVRKIGDGAVIGAGAVVHKDVPPYAIVVGHPGRIAGYRFSKETIAELLASQWWLKSMPELIGELESFCRPLEEAPSEDPPTATALAPTTVGASPAEPVAVPSAK